MSTTLTRKIYDRFLLPVEKTSTTSIDYYRGLMFVCTGYQLYQCNPTTNKVLSVVDLDVTNPVIDIDVDSYGFIYGICNNEQKIKKIDTFTGQVVEIIDVDLFQIGQIVPFRFYSSMTKTPDAFYFIDGYFNSTLKTNRLVRYDLATKISTVVHEISAANANDLEYDDIGLLRLTDVKGVIERYDIIVQSPNFGQEIDEIPVGDAVDLVEDEINPPNPSLETSDISPPDLTYFIEQPFAFLTLEPNWEYKICSNPQEWQLALNPCIPQDEVSINFIKLFDFNQPQISFLDMIQVNQDTIDITLNPLYTYNFVGVNVTDSNGKVFGSLLVSGNNVTFTLINTLNDDEITPPVFDLNTLYHLEIIVKINPEPDIEYHTFNTNFILNSYPLILNAPFDHTKPQIIAKTITDDSFKIFFNKNIDLASVNSSTVSITQIDPSTYVATNFTGTLQVIQNEIIFTGDTSFLSNFEYTVILNGVADTSNNLLGLTGFYFKYEPTAPLLNFLPNNFIPDSSFVLLLDAFEDIQSQQFDAIQEILTLEQQRTQLLRKKNIAETLTQIQEDRLNLLANYDTGIFPYNFELQHMDQVIADYTAFLSGETEQDIINDISVLDIQLSITKQYVSDLEEILRSAEFEPPNIYIQDIAKELEEQNSSANQQFVTINTFTYTLGNNSLAVYVDGIRQQRDIDYSEVSSNEIFFLSPLSVNQDIILIKFTESEPIPNVLIPADNKPVAVFDTVINHAFVPNKYERQISTVNQTDFIIKTFEYVQGSDTLLVYVNGILQSNITDYTEVTGGPLGSAEILFNNPQAGGSVIEFKEGIRLGESIQTELNLSAFQIYDSLDRLIPITDLQPFYLEILDETIVSLIISGNDYFLFGANSGETILRVHLAKTFFDVPIYVFSGYTPPLLVVPYHCPQFIAPPPDIWHLSLIDLTVPNLEELSYHRPKQESHLVITPISDTRTRQIDPGYWALMLEGTVNFPDYYDQSLLLETAQLNQSVIVQADPYTLLLIPEEDIELPMILEDSLDTDPYEPLQNYLRLSPTAFDEDLVLVESLQFDPANPIQDPLVLQQGLEFPEQSGPLEIEFVCFDTPADDSEETILLQGDSGQRHPLKITWDGDFCYVLYDGECAASLIDLKSILRKVFVSTPDPELYGLGIHNTSIFGQVRDIEGQEFPLSKIQSLGVSFIDTLNQYLNSKDSNSLNQKITVQTTGVTYGPNTLELDNSVIFNYNYQSGIQLNPGEEIILHFNEFIILEGLTYLARTMNPLQKIYIQTSDDGVNYTTHDITSINKTNISVYELNQFLYGVQTDKITTYIKFQAPLENTASVDIILVNLFNKTDKFGRTQNPVIVANSVSNNSVLIANESQNPNLEFVLTPNPSNFLNQTFAAPINPLISNPITTALESSNLQVSGIPTSSIIPALFNNADSSPAINPISPITDVRGNSELIYRSGLMTAFENSILNSDFKWGLLNWNIVGTPFIQFRPLNDKQLILTRSILNQTILSGLLTQPIEFLPFTTFYITSSGLNINANNIAFIRAEYYDINNVFLSNSTPIFLKDTDSIISIQKMTPEFTAYVRIFVGFMARNADNVTITTDTIKLDWISLTLENQSEFTSYNDNLDVIKIVVEI